MTGAPEPPSPGFVSFPDPDNPGWFTWQLNDPTRFNSWMFRKLIVRTDPDGKARLRMFPEHHHTISRAYSTAVPCCR